MFIPFVNPEEEGGRSNVANENSSLNKRANSIPVPRPAPRSSRETEWGRRGVIVLLVDLPNAAVDQRRALPSSSDIGDREED